LKKSSISNNEVIFNPNNSNEIQPQFQSQSGDQSGTGGFNEQPSGSEQELSSSSLLDEEDNENLPEDETRERPSDENRLEHSKNSIDYEYEEELEREKSNYIFSFVSILLLMPYNIFMPLIKKSFENYTFGFFMITFSFLYSLMVSSLITDISSFFILMFIYLVGVYLHAQVGSSLLFQKI